MLTEKKYIVFEFWRCRKTNAYPIPHYSETKIISLQQLHDGALDLMFEATTEVVEEAIISSLYHGETTTGIRGKTVLSLKEVMR